MKKYKSVFFDLDHTLWDFDSNSKEAITELFHLHELDNLGIPGVDDFISTYRNINHKMWSDYHQNLITRETLRSGRFQKALSVWGIEDQQLAEDLSIQYLQTCPVKTNLFPGTFEILNYLAGRYSLHIITNGFKEVQHLKITNSGLRHFFDHIHISEEIGFKKPEPEIFNHAVRIARSAHQECIMIGDNLETDIAGAENVGIDPVFFNPHGEISGRKILHEIKHLDQLRVIL